MAVVDREHPTPRTPGNNRVLETGAAADLLGEVEDRAVALGDDRLAAAKMKALHAGQGPARAEWAVDFIIDEDAAEGSARYAGRVEIVGQGQFIGIAPGGQFGGVELNRLADGLVGPFD